MTLEYLIGHPKEAGALLVVLSGLVLLLVGLLASTDRTVRYQLGVKIEIDQMAPGKKRAFELVGACLLVAGLVLLFFLVDWTGASGTPTAAAAAAASTSPPPSTAAAPSATPTAAPSTVTPRLSIGLHPGEVVAQHTVVTGTYGADMSGDLWVVLRPTNGLYYPQSTDACAGLGVAKAHGRWEVPAVFGEADDTGASFEVLAIAASSEASAVLSSTLAEWCRARDYPGLPALPAGTDEISRVLVVRGPETASAPRLVTAADLLGTVTLDSLADGDTVPDSVALRGTVSADAAGSVWVLIYPHDAGRWFPQSTDACRGINTEQDGSTWHVTGWFGAATGAGAEYTTVVALADAAADARLAALQQAWCAAGRYPGLSTIDLPLGLAEKARVVVRGQ